MVNKVGQNIKSLVVFVIIAGLLLAILSQFDYDIIAFFIWCWNHIIDWIVRLARYFVSLPIFRAFFKA